MKKNKLLIALISVLFFFGCSKNSVDAYSKENMAEKSGLEDAENDKSQIVIETNAKIIYSVNYTIHSNDINSLAKDVKDKTLEYDGYIDNSYESSSHIRITYRIPTDKLDSFIDYVDGKDGDISKSISTEDVSSSYSQVEAKIKVLTDSKAYYNEYLEENKTTLSLQDKIAILDKISAIDSELYTYSYQKDKLDSVLDYSKVVISYYPEDEKEEGFFKEYGTYLGEFFVGLGKGILYFIPFGVVFGGIFLAIFLPIRAKKRRKQ